MRILIADDEKEFVKMLEDWLRHKNIGRDIAYNGEQALELLQLNKYNLAILDHNMPGLTGLELVGYIKKNNLGCATLIITGYEEMDEAIAKAAGADEYMEKPVNIKRLTAIIEKYVQ